MMHREDHALALPQRHDFGTRLHARALLGEHEFAAGEILTWSREQEGHLQREHEFAVDVLMQAIVVARSVLQQQRGGLGLPGGAAALDVCGVVSREALIEPHLFVPAVRNVRERRIKRRAQRRHDVGQRIRKIFVFAAAEAVARHDHA